MRIKLVTVLLISVVALLIAVPVLADNEQPELLPGELSIPGEIEEASTYFEIKDSEYLNISLESTEEIKVVLESIPRMVSLDIEAVIDGINFTTLTIEGLELNKTYYKYQDSYKNEAVFISDENGSYNWIQDLTQPHHIWIQEEKGTIFLPEDCDIYGIWNEATLTCSLTQDLTESVEITVNNITLDCNGYSITGSDSGYGIYLNNREEVTIQNCIVTDFSYGVFLFYSSNNQLTNITANSNYNGILLGFSSNNTIKNSIINSNVYGITLYSRSNGNKIYHNNFINNRPDSPVIFSNCSNNVLDNGYPSGGNYWSDYTGIDVKKGSNQNESGSDGIGDTPYVFTICYPCVDYQDRYPFMTESGWEVPVNQPPTLSGLGQFKSDGIIPIPEGDTTTEPTVVFKATLDDPDNDQVKFQIELRQITEPFTGIDDGGILNSDFVDSDSEIIITREGLSNGKYHWRARAIDSQGNISDWQEFGEIENADFIVKLVPLYTQVRSPYPSDDETSVWADLPYGSGYYPGCLTGRSPYRSTIARCGCAITSMVMVGRYYNINTAINGSNVDPANINTWLTNYEGYTSDGGLWWGKAVEYLGFIDEATGKRMVRLNFNPYTDYNVPSTSPRIVNYINSAKPVVAYSEKFGHYFIAYSKLTTTYGIKDPAWYNTKTLNDDENLANKVRDYDNYFDKANLFSYLETPKPITASLNLYLASPAELLITDPLGRRLGKDPITGIVYNEIPDSIYTEEGPIVSSDTPLEPDEMHESKVIYIPLPIDGEYAIQVIGTDSGTYALDFSTYNNIGESTDASFEAVTDTGVISDYSIDYSSVPEEPTIIERIVTIQDVITEIEISHQLNLIDNNGIKNSLIKKLNNAQRQLESNRKNTTTNILNAFVNEVEAQKGKHIDLDTAELLIEDARYIIEHL